MITSIKKNEKNDVGWFSVRDFGADSSGIVDSYSSIIATINAAGVNGTILFPSGLYIISQTITPLAGQTLEFVGGATLLNKSSFSGNQLISVAVDDVTIRGAIFRGRSNNNGTWAVRVVGAKRCTLDRCKDITGYLSRLVIYEAQSEDGQVLNCYSAGTGPSGYGSNSLEFNDSNFCLAQGNTFLNSGGSGIEIYQSAGRPIFGVRVLDNDVRNAALTGIPCFGMRGCTISGNTIVGCGSYGILQRFGEETTALLCEGNTIQSNYFEDCAKTVSNSCPIFVSGQRNSILSNVISNTGATVVGTVGILLDSGDDHMVIGNSVSKVTHRGIYQGSGSRLRLISNTIIDAGPSGGSAYGIELVLAQYAQVIGNTCVDTRSGGSRGMAYGLVAGSGTANCVLQNNVFTNFTTLSFVNSGTSNVSDVEFSRSVVTTAFLNAASGPVKVGPSSGGTYNSSGVIALNSHSTSAGGIAFGANSGEILYRPQTNFLASSGGFVANGELYGTSFVSAASYFRVSNGREFRMTGNSTTLAISDSTASAGIVTYTGGAVSANFSTFHSTVEATTAGAGAVVLAGGLYVAKRIVCASSISVTLPTYADNAAALSGGLAAKDMYKTATGEVRIVV